MVDAAVGAWKMSLLQDHVKSDCCYSCDCCLLDQECEVEESELLLNESWKRVSMKVELWYSHIVEVMLL
jgi:hypothetical protein